ncbi:MAG: toll/interleukin-1 receptor domain-containing protein [Pseudomonadota bacterium]
MSEPKKAKAQYAAFLSYAHADRKAAIALQKTLERYRVPRELRGRFAGRDRIAPIFRDEDDLEAHSDLTGRVRQALASSDFLIVVCSPAAARSRWVNLEIAEFAALRGRDAIVAVIATGEPTVFNEASAPEGAFPPALLYALDADGHPIGDIHPEPLAPSLEARKGEKPKTVLSLTAQRVAARLLGVSLTEFAGREALDERRRRRRSQALATAFAGVAAVAVAAGGWARLESLRAERERARADANYALAVDAAETVTSEIIEGLINVEGVAIGSLDAIAEAADGVLSELASQQDVVGRDFSGLQAALFHQIGVIEFNRGRIEAVERARERIVDVYEAERALGAPSVRVETYYGVSFCLQASVHRAREEYRSAAEAADQCVRRILEASRAAVDPADAATFPPLLFGAYVDRGETQRLLGDIDAAAEDLAAARAIVETNTGVEEISEAGIATMYDLEGQIAEARGKGVEALAAYESAIERLQAAARDYDTASKRRRGILYYRKAHVQHFFQYDSEAALISIEMAVSTFRAIADSDPDRERWGLDLAQALDFKGIILGWLRREDEALAAYEEALAIREGVAASGDVDAARIESLLAESYRSIGVLLAQTGQAEEGLAALDKALSIFRSRYDAEPALETGRSLASLFDSMATARIILAGDVVTDEAAGFFDQSEDVYLDMADRFPTAIDFFIDSYLLVALRRRLGYVDRGDDARALSSILPAYRLARPLAQTRESVEFQVYYFVLEASIVEAVGTEACPALFEALLDRQDALSESLPDNYVEWTPPGEGPIDPETAGVLEFCR